MSKTTHQLAVKATDQTAGAFSSIQARASAASAKLRSMLGGALAAAGAYFGFRSIVNSINELGKLSDIAQKSSVSVDELTKSATAMNVLGIQNMGPEQMAKAFQLMEKNTGRTGMAGFYQTIDELGKIPDVSERASAAMKVFGKSGIEFIPLINAADTSVDALKDVIDVMPGIPQSAADAGDDVADAMTIASDGVKSVWMAGIGAICGWFGKNYTGGIRQAAAEGANALMYYAKVGVQKAMEYYRSFTGFFEKLGGAIGTFVGAKMNGASWSDALDMAKNDWIETGRAQEIVAEIQKKTDAERRARWEAEFEDRKVKIERFGKQYAKATRTSKDRSLLEGGGDLLGGKMNKLTNELILGGSAKSLNLAMMGPQMSNELKKQTNILERIRVNTQKTEENTRDTAEGENYEVIS